MQVRYGFGHEYSQTAALTCVGYVLHGVGGGSACEAFCKRMRSLTSNAAVVALVRDRNWTVFDDDDDDDGGGGGSGR